MMNVYIESTSLPHIMKFVAPYPLVKGSYEFNNVEEAELSPMAKRLFHLSCVKKVYITANFVAVESFSDVLWESVVDEIKQIINGFLEKGGPIITGENPIIKKQPLTIYAEFTPNPDTVKFVSNRVITDQFLEFKDRVEASVSPLALELFQYPFVKEIFFNENYISITQVGSIDWMDLISPLKENIKSLLTENYPLLKEGMDLEPKNLRKRDFSKQEKDIESVIEEYIRPAVAADGGYISLSHYDTDTKTVHLILQGACSGCPSSAVTLQQGVLTVLQQMLPNKINAVEAINA